MVTPNILSPSALARQLGGRVKKTESLSVLAPLEKYVQESAPLPLTYDISRPQPWYFDEFGYTEFLGGLYVYPLNDEMACRVMARPRPLMKLDGREIILANLARRQTLDKYELTKCDEVVKHLVILPGSNLLYHITSHELITSVMWKYEDAKLKPHPLTNDEDLKKLRKEYGVTRVLEPKSSGFQLLTNARTVWATGTTELTAYATILGKSVKSVDNIFTGRASTYYPTFRLLVDAPVSVARARLDRIFSGASGLIFAEDHNWQLRIDQFFSDVMKLRRRFKPLIYQRSMMPPRPIPVGKKESPDAVRED